MRSRSTDAKLAALRRVPFLSGRSDAELTKLARLADQADLPEGYVLMTEGSKGREAVVIIEGWAAVMHGDETVAAVGPGEVVGEMSLLDHGRRSATVVAKTPMKVLVVGVAQFAMFADQPAVGRTIATNLSRRLREVEGAQN
jgi:cAMP-dependent protein kinase regulator